MAADQAGEIAKKEVTVIRTKLKLQEACKKDLMVNLDGIFDLIFDVHIDIARAFNRCGNKVTSNRSHIFSIVSLRHIFNKSLVCNTS